MNASGNLDRATRHAPDARRAMPGCIEFEELDDFAADAGDVTRMIERDGSVALDFGSFDFE